MKIRMLVDWSQLEVFTPDDSSLNLYATGGEVKLVSLELNEVARTWPGKAE